jgi:Mg2+ and Co2+ transporter CorA
MSIEFLEPLQAESENLDLHTKLCAARYQQITQHFDVINLRLNNIETTLKEIQSVVSNNQNAILNRFLSWGGIAVVTLTAIIGWLLSHYVLK